MEEFKDIPWYEWLYQVNNIGKIKSLRKNIIMKNQVDKYWYEQILLSDWKRRKTKKIHRLVLLTFIWNSDLDCNHKNWIKDDNRLENLEYCTRRENIMHCINVLWKHSTKWKYWKQNVRSKAILQFDMDWKFIKEWGSWRFMQRQIWICHKRVSECVTWKRDNFWWYLWKFKTI